LQAIIEQEVPDITKTTRLLYEKVLMRFEDKIFNNQHIFWGDGAFFEIFGLDLKPGSDIKALYTKNTCFISETAARRFFGDADPINKTVQLNQAINFVVAGVYKDIPANAHFQCDFVVSYITLRDHADEWILNSLEALMVYTYFKTDNKVSVETLNNKLETLKRTHFNLKSNVEVNLEAQPLSDIHLKSHLNDELKSNSYFKYIIILIFISVFLIVCGWINYFNLLSLNFIDRIKNINIKFSLGATKGAILFQFIVESVIVNTLCVVLSVFFTCCFLIISETICRFRDLNSLYPILYLP
jgi:putative ABC transport system permease protein